LDFHTAVGSSGGHHEMNLCHSSLHYEALEAYE
jgi:hypothetical protein